MGKKPDENEEGATVHRPKQRELEGFEAIEDPELRKKVHEYVAVRDKRMGLIPREVELRNELLALMKAKKVKACSVDEFIVQIVVEEEKVKVKRTKPKDEDEE